MDEKAIGRLKHISPDLIKQNPENPRIVFRQAEMENLMVSISQHGIQVPITVYEDRNVFYLIDGERRWRCAKKLNLKRVPALIQQKPTPLENLLLMYNIHALREQWDYYTIASKLERIIDLHETEYGKRPTENELSKLTGLTRSQIRRCQLLLDLPKRFKDMLLEELQLPKSRQRLSEDLFIEMERSLKTVIKRIPEFGERVDDIREALVEKFKSGIIGSVTDFRQLAKIATAVDNLGVAKKHAEKTLNNIFDPNKNLSIRDAYSETVEFEYDEKRAMRQVELLNEFFDDILEERQYKTLDKEFIGQIKELYYRLQKLLEVD